jgi:PhzF family phenazine biosynthesis protein
MTKLPLYWVDAFTETVFHGNPAAVVPLTTWLPDPILQCIAMENGLSETAFFVRTAPDRGQLRWFTPAVEVDLCGHATLATAFTLFTQLNQGGQRITFDSRSGPLTVIRLADGRLELDFPSRPSEPAATPVALAQALGHAPEMVARTTASWLCVYATAAEVRALRPDQTRLCQISPGRMIVTAPGGAGDDCDFVSRFFAPDAGVPEDPVTGSAHCTLIPYWAQRLGKSRLHARQVSARGGDLTCEWRGDRVGIAGHAVLYLRGEIEV